MRRYVFVVLITVGCETPPPECTSATLDTQCLPLYQPTYTNVYTNTIAVSCGASNGSCHAAGGEGKLSFADPITAYNALAPFTQGGDAACSELIVRTHDLGTDYSMPPDSPLPAAERCAILQWVAAGAEP